MHHLTEIAIYLGAALITVPLFRRLGFGAVLGYLFAGMLIGPSVLGLIEGDEAVMQVGEIGVVMLLFIIGLELKPHRLLVMRRSIFFNGTLQVLFSSVPLAFAAAWAFDLPPLTAGLIGFSMALSSTAFVLQTLGEKKQIATIHGRAAFGILLFQDLAVIPVLAIIPMLLPETSTEASISVGTRILQAGGAVIGLVLGGHYLLLPLLRAISRWGDEDSFTVVGLLVVLSAALLMEWAGLSMGLGAFLAGVLLADSEYRHELEGNLSPFKGLLLGLFFISVGMAANFEVLREDLPLILIGTAGLLLIKAATLWLSSSLLQVDQTNASQLGLILAQGGEFAFVLFQAMSEEGLLPPDINEQLTAIVILSMMLTPLLFTLSDKLGLRARIQHGEEAYDTIDPEETPVILAGFGRMGQIIARVLQMRGIAFTALEKDAAHVALVRRWGNKIYYGQATNLETLRAAGAGTAKILIVTMDDSEKALRTIELAQRHFPHLHIFARARDRHQAMHLLAMGVHDVIRETWHSSLEMATHVLQALGDTEAAARYSTKAFREADEAFLMQQLSHRDDDDELIQSANQLREELRVLFEADPHLTPLPSAIPSDEESSDDPDLR